MKKFGAVLVLLALIAVPLMGCVDQHPESQNAHADESGLRIATTSVAIMEMMDLLDVDLIGVPNSDNADYPVRYSNVDRIGMPMSPDVEILMSLSPDVVLSPVSLEGDLKPQYEAAGLGYFFMDMSNIDGMYSSLVEFADMIDRKEQAQILVDDYQASIAEYQEFSEGKDQPKVLILMGLPGSYTVATDKSYAGSLIKKAGGINVYADEEDFINVNTEDMLAKDPDIILRTAHALPESVMKMFAEEFEENDIWKHFRAVQEGSVYDLSYEQFGMSANFNYRDGLDAAFKYLYESE